MSRGRKPDRCFPLNILRWTALRILIWLSFSYAIVMLFTESWMTSSNVESTLLMIISRRTLSTPTTNPSVIITHHNATNQSAAATISQPKLKRTSGTSPRNTPPRNSPHLSPNAVHQGNSGNHTPNHSRTHSKNNASILLQSRYRNGQKYEANNNRYDGAELRNGSKRNDPNRTRDGNGLRTKQKQYLNNKAQDVRNGNTVYTQRHNPTGPPPSKQEWIDPFQNIREMRTKRPRRCPNSSHPLFPITPSNHNWAPYYFRCNDLYHRRKAVKPQWMSEAVLSKELFYVHVFKAGGTSVMGNIKRMSQNGIFRHLTPLESDISLFRGDLFVNNSKYSQSSILENFIDDNTITFSFVRDPVDKFLSAFYEAHRPMHAWNHSEYRVELAAKYKDKSGIHILRLWMDEIERLTANGIHTFVDSHLKPNMYFLTGQHYETSIPFNFIGDLKHFGEDFPQIVRQFVVDKELRRNRTKLQELMIQKRTRSHHTFDEDLSRFQVDRSQLSNEDIQRICELYWLDYLCFPFDIPRQCNVHKLMEKHYGIDVVYNDCY